MAPVKTSKKFSGYYIDKNELRKWNQLNPNRATEAIEEAEKLTTLVNGAFNTKQQIKIEILIE